MKNASMASLACAVLLAACGGGGGNDSPAPPATATTPPASAGESPEGLVGFLEKLAAQLGDTEEPLDVSAFKPPTTDSAEPLALK